MRCRTPGDTRSWQAAFLFSILFSVLRAHGSPPDPSAVFGVNDDADGVSVLEQFLRAQKEVAATWRYDPTLVCRAAGVFGPMEKLGNHQSNKGVLRRKVYTRRALAAAGVPVYSRGQVWISHQHRFIYLRQPKSSSTTILAALRAQFCESSTCEPKELARELFSVEPDTWRDYFVFSVVRNPIARMLSTFLMFKHLLRRRLTGTLAPGEPCSMPFAAFARDPFALRQICDSQSCCTFLHEQHDGHVLDSWYEDFVNMHICQQAHLLFDPQGRAVVDFVGRTEALQEDWPQIIARIRRRATSEPADGDLPMLNAHLTRDNVSAVTAGDAPPGHPCLPRDVVAMGLLNETTVYDLAMKFAMDMRMLKYV